MSNSALICCTVYSPNHSGKRTESIDRISIHCMAGNLSVESCGALFAKSSREASSQYGVGSDGRIGLYVDEANRSWCTSSRANDQRAVTIEVANTEAKHPWPVSDKAYKALLDLVTDICKRNGKNKVIWMSDKEKALAYSPKAGEMVLTIHRWFANKACPGDTLYNKHDAIVEEVNKRLGSATDAPAADTKAEIDEGSVVKITGNTYYSGKAVPPWVKAKNWVVQSRSGDRVVINKSEDGKHAIMSPVNIKDLALVSGPAADTPTTDTPTVAVPYLVKVTADALNVRKGPGTNYGISAVIRDKGTYTIVQEQSGWGKLKSGVGWICLDYTKKV